MSALPLTSFVNDAWTAGSGPPVPILDATTGQTVASMTPAGIDFAQVLDFGRSVGAKELGRLTFHERATILRNLGKLLLDMETKKSLYEISTTTGATRTDSWIDIDGGAGVLLTYASKARKELPNDTVIVEGPAEVLSADGSFTAIHTLNSTGGVEVQINAYNFPVWGMLEKFAPSFLAGMPSIVKPAPQTAHLTHAAVELIVESALLPPGSLQLTCTAPGDLLTQLDGQDHVAFTGSASTAHALRRHPDLVRRSVHFSAELDSLNSAILTSSAAPGTVEFDLFIAEIVKEITTKAGQKCTAIRRALVPEAFVDAAATALTDAVSSVVVGDPRNPDTAMGPVVSTAQRDSVNGAIAELQSAAEIITGNCDYLDADPEVGAFVAPTVLRATDPHAAVLHSIEAFGPVATLFGYRDTADAITLSAAGAGSLVASVYGSDTDEIRTFARGIASHHGRIMVVDETMAAASTGHGSPLPHLTHGGPGRAGGGEELGGMRSVYSHMQRTAIQGSPKMLTAIGGEYITGAPTTDNGHPFRLTFDDLKVGDSFTSESRAITRDDIAHFAEFTGDKFYAHIDEEAAARSPIFGGIVAHGYLIVSFAAGLFVDPPEGPVLANYGIDRLRFATPTKPDDEIHVVLTCKRKTQLNGRGYGEVAWATQVVNQHGEIAAVYDVLTMVANRPGINGAPE